MPKLTPVPFALALALLAGGTASAAEPVPMLPDLAVEDGNAKRFEGLYTGLYMGFLSNYPANFYWDTGSGWHPNRFALGGIVGWNHYLGDHFVVGAEAQAGLHLNTSGDYGIDAEALFRLGLTPHGDWLVYAAGGLGTIDRTATYALGGGVEYALWRDASVRAEVLGIGQIGETWSGQRADGFSAAKATISAIWHFGDDGAGLPAVPAQDTDKTGFEGLYAGLYFGGIGNNKLNYFDWQGNGWNNHRYAVGGVLGWNQFLTEAMLVGLEVQAGGTFNPAGDRALDTLALVRLGFETSDDVLVYVAGGPGTLQDKGLFALGAGFEYNISSNLGLRGEAIAIGQIGPQAHSADLQDVWGFSGITLRAGALWHFN